MIFITKKYYESNITKWYHYIAVQDFLIRTCWKQHLSKLHLAKLCQVEKSNSYYFSLEITSIVNLILIVLNHIWIFGKAFM